MADLYVSKEKKTNNLNNPSYQAYLLLLFSFTAIPILFGIDKFFNFYTEWDKFLASQLNVLNDPNAMMIVVGMSEIIVGIGVWLYPKIFSYIVALWLAVIIINLLILGHYYDIAINDFGLFLGALAFARLSQKYSPNKFGAI